MQAELERWGVVLIYATLRHVCSLERLPPAAAAVLSAEELLVIEKSPKAVYAVVARLRVLLAGAQLPAEKVGGFVVAEPCLDLYSNYVSLPRSCILWDAAPCHE